MSSFLGGKTATRMCGFVATRILCLVTNFESTRNLPDWALTFYRLS
jgi:hypothetical protein